MSEACHRRPPAARAAAALLGRALLLALGVCCVIELSRPDLLIVGPITVDLVDGTTPTGGAVSYAAVAARALRASSCVVTVAGPEADLGVFEGAHLFVVRAPQTLTFEHSYTWFGHSRKLRVTASPNITLTRAHVPMRCRWARTVLLGPLTLHDVDAGSFVRPQGFWDRLINRRQQIGLMAQGFQRALGPHGEVLPLPGGPSQQLLDGLGPRVSLFLSDVETDSWPAGSLERVAAATACTLVTLGEHGAQLLTPTPGGASAGSDGSSSSSGVGASSSSSSGSEVGGSGGSSSGSSGGVVRRHIPAVRVSKAVDTNGAGDTFASVFALAQLRGDADPGATAAWAASRAVLQPQSCKPRCAPALITAPLSAAAADAVPPPPGARVGRGGGLAPLSPAERLWLALAPDQLRQAGRVLAAWWRAAARSGGGADELSSKMLGVRASSRAGGLAAPSAPLRAGRAFVPVVAKQADRKQRTQARHLRIRKKLAGTPERPRLAVYRSNQHIYAQVIDDVAGRTLASASTLSPEVKATLEDGNGSNTAAAEAVGKQLAALCRSKSISKVAFDRGGFKYHGRVQALADAAREGGLDF